MQLIKTWHRCNYLQHLQPHHTYHLRLCHPYNYSHVIYICHVCQNWLINTLIHIKLETNWRKGLPMTFQLFESLIVLFIGPLTIAYNSIGREELSGISIRQNCYSRNMNNCSQPHECEPATNFFLIFLFFLLSQTVC